MANLVEYIVKIRDLASGQWKTFANAGEGAFNRMNTKMRTTGSSVDNLNAKINALTKTRDMSLNTSAIARANREIDQLEKKRDRLQNTGRFTSGMGGLLGQGLALAGIGGGAYLAKDIMQAGIERQMNLTAFQTLLGNKNGNALNSQLLDFAKKSIYGNEVFNEGKLMAGSGIAAGNIMPVMKMIGDIAMGDKERMKSLALAFSEANTRGSLTGINERMFLQGGLFNPLEQIHKMSGRSLADLKKDMEKGKISIDMLVKSMEYATGPAGRWHDMMKKMQDTPAGKWTAFTGTLRTLAGTIGVSLLPVLGRLTDIMQTIIGNPDALYLIANGIGAITAAWGLYTIATNWAAISTAALEAVAYWPIAAAIAIAIAAGEISRSNDAMVDSTGKAVSGISWWADKLKLTYKGVAYYAEYIWYDILDKFERFNNLMKLHSWKFKDAWNALTAPTDAGQTLEKIKNARENWLNDRKAAQEGYVKIDPKTGKPIKSTSPLDAFMNGGKWSGAPGGAVPDGVADSARGITGGGVRNQTININKLGTDTITINTTNLREGTAEIQRMFIEMFNQVINSGNAAVSPQ